MPTHESLPAAHVCDTTDAELAIAFDRGEVPHAEFHHREHLRVAWAYLQTYGTVDAAAAHMRTTLMAFAGAVGKADKYHETLTVFWIRLLAQIREGLDEVGEFDDILSAHGYLLDKDTPLAYYSRARLFSDEARLVWVAPDVRSLES